MKQFNTVNKVKKIYWVKGKSKFLSYREDLQVNAEQEQFDISGDFKMKQLETVRANVERRAKMKINQDPSPKSYYKDCYVNTPEYKRDRERFFR